MLKPIVTRGSVLLLLALGCTSSAEKADTGTSLPPPDSGSDAPTVDVRTGETVVEPAPTCDEHPAPRLTAGAGAVLELPITVELAGKPLRFAEANSASGQTVTPLNLRFYVSAVSLTRTDGSAIVPVDLITAAGAVEPYGIHFFNAEDPASSVLRVRVPAGSYKELRFAFGLDDRCNAGPPERNPPLSAASQMTWPHGFGYLFLRYEARVDPATGNPAGADAGVTELPTAIHMGGFPDLLPAPGIRLPASLTIPAGGTTTRPLRLVMEQVFKGATAMVPDGRAAAGIPAPPGLETLLGEHLRQTAPGLPIFVLTP